MYILDTYEPKNLKECLNKSTALSLEAWYKNYKRPALIVGSVGIGKSTLVRLFAKEKNLTLYELCPSDDKDKETLEPILQAVSQSRSIFSNKNLLFFDDIDVFISDDKGTFEAILKTAKESINPVIFCATNLYSDKKLSALRDICEIIEMRSVHSATLVAYLTTMCTRHNIKCERDALEELIKMNSGDLRSTFLDIDFLKPFGITKANLSLLSGRERKADVFKTIIGLFKAKTFEEAKNISDNSEIDYDLLFAWLSENLHLFYEKENLKEAYNFMSLADINKARIYSRQNWIFFRYFLSLGIIAPALVPKKDHFTFKISYTQSIKLKAKELSDYSKNKKAANILSKIFRGSNYKISAEIFLYKFFFKDNGFVSYISENVTDDEFEFFEDFFKFKLPKKEKVIDIIEEKHEKKQSKKDDLKEIITEERKVGPKKEENKKEKEKQRKLF